MKNKKDRERSIKMGEYVTPAFPKPTKDIDRKAQAKKVNERARTRKAFSKDFSPEEEKESIDPRPPASIGTFDFYYDQIIGRIDLESDEENIIKAMVFIMSEREDKFSIDYLGRELKKNNQPNSAVIKVLFIISERAKLQHEGKEVFFKDFEVGKYLFDKALEQLQEQCDECDIDNIPYFSRIFKYIFLTKDHYSGHNINQMEKNIDEQGIYAPKFRKDYRSIEIEKRNQRIREVREELIKHLKYFQGYPIEREFLIARYGLDGSASKKFHDVKYHLRRTFPGEKIDIKKVFRNCLNRIKDCNLNEGEELCSKILSVSMVIASRLKK